MSSPEQSTNEDLLVCQSLQQEHLGTASWPANVHDFAVHIESARSAAKKEFTAMTPEARQTMAAKIVANLSESEQ